MNYEQANSVKELAPGVMKVLEGLEWIEYLKEQKGGIVKKYSWTPQLGEWCIVKGRLHLITKTASKLVIEVIPTPAIYDRPLEKSDAIPILSWEEIRMIIKQAGYSISITSGAAGGEIVVYKEMDIIYKKYHNNNLQEVVMKVVIELRKELK